MLFSRGSGKAIGMKKTCFSLRRQDRKEKTTEELSLRSSSLRSLRLCEKSLLILAVLATLTGCGYHVSGHGDLMPKTIKTIAIPAFGNRTTRYKLARTLPTDIGREMLARTKYAVVTDPKEADAVLTGTVHNFAAYPTISANGRATVVEVIVTLNLTLTERATGAVLFNRPGAEFRERYEISIEPQAYFDESGTAMERLSKSVARSVVSAILEKF
jgi:outer membrane lipopolysaccharide assembly protein LptE/RlpB